MRRIIGNHPEGTAFNPHKAGNHALAISAAQFQKTARIGNHLNRLAHIISALSILGNNMAQLALVVAVMGFQCTLKIAEQLLGHSGRMRLVLGQQIDHAVFGLNIHRPDICRRDLSQPAAFNHRRTAHADIAVFGSDGDIGTPEQHRITGKAIAIIHGDARRDPAGLRPSGEGHHVQTTAGNFAGIRIAGATAAALSIEDGRHLPFMRHFQNAVSLFMIEQPLRAGQHRIVISQHRRARRIIVEHIAIHRAKTGDQPVGGCVVDKVVQIAALTLRRHHELAIFDKAALVAKVIDIFARRAMALLVPLGNLLGSIGVLRASQPRLQFSQVSAHPFKVLGRYLRRRIASRLTGLDRKHHRALFDHFADIIFNGLHRARNRRGQSMLHFHRFQNDKLLTGRHAVARRHVNGMHHGLHGCFDWFRFSHDSIGYSLDA